MQEPRGLAWPEAVFVRERVPPVRDLLMGPILLLVPGLLGQHGQGGAADGPAEGELERAGPDGDLAAAARHRLAQGRRHAGELEVAVVVAGLRLDLIAARGEPIGQHRPAERAALTGRVVAVPVPRVRGD